jgi:GTP cyclohydrolase I
LLRKWLPTPQAFSPVGEKFSRGKGLLGVEKFPSTEKMDDGDGIATEAELRRWLRDLGEDPSREGLEETPHRFRAMLHEMVESAQQPRENFWVKTFPAPGYDDWILLDHIPFGSLCEHHLLPFTGQISIAYWPLGERVVGLSKLVRLTEWLAHRLQLQERLTVQLATEIFQHLPARAVGVKIVAEHLCMAIRGVAKPNILTTTVHRCGEAPRWPF